MDEGNVEMTTQADNEIDPGLSVLVMLLGFHGVGADPEQIRHRFGRGTIGIPQMLRCAKELGLKARATPDHLGTACQCAVAGDRGLRNGGFLLLGKVGDDKALVQSPFRRVPP